tara:strand:- start:115 stop:315 length:201 start_codon:yes stop_codon:yes gene_type:complete
MSTEQTPSEDSKTEETDAGTKLGNETVRPPDPLRDSKNNPDRPGFRNKPNKGSKAQKKGNKKKKRK